MLFHSQIFLLLFLPVTLFGYYGLARKPGGRIWWLILASFVFYGYWDYRLIPLLAGSIIVNWLLARLHPRVPARLIAILGVTANLLVLGIFKYADFFADVAAWFSGQPREPWSIILPLGISFFTFQQISYLVDLERRGTPAYGFRDYALFVCFFPQLIAGPIVRHNELIPQFEITPLRPGLNERMSRGFILLICGVAKKVFVADPLARIADPIFSAAAAGNPLSFADGWIASCAFGLQIYFDFSGYSDMALGLALLFGFALPVNFERPYIATSIRDFWRRWHITLSRFLRDYLYIPLGGSRKGPVVGAAALMATMLLGGLWHGAGMTFVIWGGLHGLALAINHAWSKAAIPLAPVLAWAFTMLFVFIAWVLFRADSFDAAVGIYRAMILLGPIGPLASAGESSAFWIIPAAALLAMIGPTAHRLATELVQPRYWLAAGSATLLVAVLLQTGIGANKEFIYFQF